MPHIRDCLRWLWWITSKDSPILAPYERNKYCMTGHYFSDFRMNSNHYRSAVTNLGCCLILLLMMTNANDFLVPVVFFCLFVCLFVFVFVFLFFVGFFSRGRGLFFQAIPTFDFVQLISIISVVLCSRCWWKYNHQTSFTCHLIHWILL